MRNNYMEIRAVSFVKAGIKNDLELTHLQSGGTHGPVRKYELISLSK